MCVILRGMWEPIYSVRYGADQELRPNKRRAASEAAGLSVKWERSIPRWNMEMFCKLCWHKWALVAAKKTQRRTHPYLPKKRQIKLESKDCCLVSWLVDKGVVVSNTVLYLGPDLSWGQIWADHPLLPTMPSHNREQSSWQMVNHKSFRLFPRDAIDNSFDPSDQLWHLSCLTNLRKDGLLKLIHQ